MAVMILPVTWHLIPDDDVHKQINSRCVAKMNLISLYIVLELSCYQTHVSRFTVDNNYMSIVCKKQIYTRILLRKQKLTNVQAV
jgi:hypothetical protein